MAPQVQAPDTCQPRRSTVEMLDPDPTSRIPGSLGWNPRFVGTPGPGAAASHPLEKPSAGPAPGHFPGSCIHSLVFPSPLFVCLFFMSGGQSWNRWLCLCDMWLARPRGRKLHVPCTEGPIPQHLEAWPQSRLPGGGRKRWTGDTGDDMPCLQPERGVHGFPLVLEQIPTCSAASNNTHRSPYSSEGQKSPLNLPRLKSGVGRAVSFWKLQGRIRFLMFPSCQRPPAFLACGHLTPAFAPITSAPSTLALALPLRRTPVITPPPTPTPLPGNPA